MIVSFTGFPPRSPTGCAFNQRWHLGTLRCCPGGCPRCDAHRGCFHSLHIQGASPCCCCRSCVSSAPAGSPARSRDTQAVTTSPTARRWQHGPELWHNCPLQSQCPQSCPSTAPSCSCSLPKSAWDSPGSGIWTFGVVAQGAFPRTVTAHWESLATQSATTPQSWGDQGGDPVTASCDFGPLALLQAEPGAASPSPCSGRFWVWCLAWGEQFPLIL